MHELYKLEDKLMQELMSYSEEEINSPNVEAVDTLAHALKNLMKIIDCKENEYSGRGMYGGMHGSNYGRSYDGYYDGRYDGTYYGTYGDSAHVMGGGSTANRNSMGRYAGDGYSRDGKLDEIIHELRNMAGNLPVNKQEDVNRLIMKMEKIQFNRPPLERVAVFVEKRCLLWLLRLTTFVRIVVRNTTPVITAIETEVATATDV